MVCVLQDTGLLHYNVESTFLGLYSVEKYVSTLDRYTLREIWNILKLNSVLVH